MTGNIIFLNGTSSSGKSDIAHALQEHIEQPYFYFLIDRCLHMLPEKHMSHADKELPHAHGQIVAEVFPKTISALHQNIAVFVSSGVNLLVDHVLQRRDWLEECVKLLNGRRVLFVGVFCDPQVVRRKESERSMPSGLGDRQIASVHSHDLYDLSVDTCQMTIDEIAGLIMQAQHEPSLPTAFQQLETMFAGGELI